MALLDHAGTHACQLETQASDLCTSLPTSYQSVTGARTLRSGDDLNLRWQRAVSHPLRHDLTPNGQQTTLGLSGHDEMLDVECINARLSGQPAGDDRVKNTGSLIGGLPAALGDRQQVRRRVAAFRAASPDGWDVTCRQMASWGTRMCQTVTAGSG